MSTISPSALNSSEQAQLEQTIEMFEVITQSQPLDYQSLEILKEAYAKLGREADAVSTSKRIAQAYVQLGQLSSAILEYETILQRAPDDTDVLSALKQIESQAANFPAEPSFVDPLAAAKSHLPAAVKAGRPAGKTPSRELEDGRRAMQKIFAESKIITPGDFDLCWNTPDLSAPPREVIEPFIQVLADKGILTIEKSLKLLSDKSRTAFIPLDHYDVDLDLTRTLPAEICRRWCILPFDRMSKSIFVATANPFNQQAIKELSECTSSRLLWYLAVPADLVSNLRKAFR